ncbi:MAG: acetyl-CoA carboxylase biotin carboxyl carrier protein [Pseudomonadota bacterium]
MSKLELDEDLVRKLSDLLEETGLSEIEYEAGGHRIRVARNAVAQIAAPAAPLPQSAPAETKAQAPAGDAVPENAITAPMVGTAYVAAEPGSPPFVSVGDEVREGQTLLIIEAMKVMNPIPCPKAGRVSRILVHDGQPVEYGEPLMVID